MMEKPSGRHLDGDRGSRGSEDFSASVRGDALRALGAASLAHALLLLVLGAVFVAIRSPAPLQLKVRAELQNEVSREEGGPSRRRQPPKYLQPAAGPRPEPGKTAIAWEETVIDSVTRAGPPEAFLATEEVTPWDNPGQAGTGKQGDRPVPERGELPVQGWTGIQITMGQYWSLPRIARVILGGPAHRQGVLGSADHGDYILTVDGRSTAGLTLEKVRDLIVGQAGTEVILGIAKSPRSPMRMVRILRGR